MKSRFLGFDLSREDAQKLYTDRRLTFDTTLAATLFQGEQPVRVTIDWHTRWILLDFGSWEARSLMDNNLANCAIVDADKLAEDYRDNPDFEFEEEKDHEPFTNPDGTCMFCGRVHRRDEPPTN